jgi:GGDEF domain-containing protein
LYTDLQLLTDLIQYDAETGLLRWQYVRQKMDDELTRSRRYKKNFSLIMLEPANSVINDVSDDRRKEINQNIAKLLTQTCRINVDSPFFGQHFGVILPETDADGSVGFAKRLLVNSAHRVLLDLRIAIVSFPDDGVTTEELISACEKTLKKAMTSDEAIVRYDNAYQAQPTKTMVPLEPKPSMSPTPLPPPMPEAPPKKANNYLDNLETDESLLAFSKFYRMTDLSLIKANLAHIKEIKKVSLLEYTSGRLLFKINSNTVLTDKDFSNLRGLRIKGIRSFGKMIEIELDN